MTNQEYADSLRLVADFYESNPDLGQPMSSDRMEVYASGGREELAIYARALPGKIDKLVDGTFYRLSTLFGSITFQAIDYRTHVCEKKLVGTVVKIKQTPTAFKEESVTEEVYEWVCPDSLLAPENPKEG